MNVCGLLFSFNTFLKQKFTKQSHNSAEEAKQVVHNQKTNSLILFGDSEGPQRQRKNIWRPCYTVACAQDQIYPAFLFD